MSFSYSDYFHFTGKVNRGSTDHRPLSIETKTASAEHLWWYTRTMLNDHPWTWVLEASYGTGKQEHQRPLLGMTHGNGKPLRRNESRETVDA
jgi:hypothetical protein